MESTPPEIPYQIRPNEDSTFTQYQKVLLH